MWPIWASYVVVGAFWGCTNPFLRRATNDVTHIKRDGAVAQFLAEMRHTFTNIGFIVPFGINQLGSLLNVKLLGEAPLSTAVPACNALSFVFTAIVGALLGEHQQAERPGQVAAGITMVLAGLTICVRSTAAASI